MFPLFAYVVLTLYTSAKEKFVKAKGTRKFKRNGHAQ